MYDSMVEARHKEANVKLKSRLGKILKYRGAAKRMDIGTNAGTATNGQGKLRL